VQPNHVQQWVLQAFRADTCEDLFVSGGLGGGKTAIGAQATCEAVGVNAQRTGGALIHYAIVSSDFSQLDRVTLENFRGVYNAMTGIRGSSKDAFRANPTVLSVDEQKHKALLACGAEIHWGTGDNAARAIEGAEYTVIWVDEPSLCKEATQERVRERLRENIPDTVQGIISTGTPRPGWSLSWLHEHFGKGLHDYVPNDIGECRVALPTELNAHNLKPGYIERLKRIYSPQMMEAMLKGRFVILSGQVYPDWGEASIVTCGQDSTKPIFVGWDPGYRRAAYVVAQPTHAYADGQPLIGTEGWTIIDELMTADMGTEQQARKLAVLPCMKGRSFITVAHDPAAVAQQSATGTNDMKVLRDVLAEYGIDVNYRSSRRKEDHAISARCERLRATMCNAAGERRLTIGRHVTTRRYTNGEDNKPCLGIHQSLLEQPFKKGKDVPDDGPNWKHATHAPDALGYLAVYLNPVRLPDKGEYRAALDGSEVDGFMGEDEGNDWGAAGMAY